MSEIKTLSEYATWAQEKWFGLGPDGFGDRDITIMSLGLAGETGEVLEVLKKGIRDGNLDMTNLKKELGDVLYYWTMICTTFGFTPEEVMQGNISKLEDRSKRNVMSGSGDDR